MTFELFCFLQLQKVLRELTLKKPQLNDLLNTAENLKGDIKRQQLQEKGEFYICHKYKTHYKRLLSNYLYTHVLWRV